jgi:hypothetical protein
MMMEVLESGRVVIEREERHKGARSARLRLATGARDRRVQENSTKSMRAAQPPSVESDSIEALAPRVSRGSSTDEPTAP